MSTKDEIFDYVMHSPENTNPAVLGSMLNSLEEGGGIEYFDVTYTCEEENDDPTIDKTIAQIQNAIEEGKILRFKWGAQSYFGEHVITFAGATTSYTVYDDDGNFAGIFVIFYGAGDSDNYYQFTIEIQNGYISGWASQFV